METFTGNEDTDLYILSLMEDEDVENLCDANTTMHHLCKKIWIHKIKLLYPDFPLNLAEQNKAMYYKLKYNKWSDIVTWTEINHVPLSKWIINNPIYSNYVMSTISKQLNAIHVAREKYIKTPLAIALFKFIYTHRQLFNTDEWMKFKNALILKLISLRDQEPDLYDLFDMYIKFLQ